MKVPKDTPSYIIAFFTVALLMFVAWQVGGVMDTQRQLLEDAEARTERAEQRNENLVGILSDGRNEWGPALEESLRLLTQLCDAEPSCDPGG